MSFVTSTLPSLLLPQKLALPKKPRKTRKSRRALKKTVKATDDEGKSTTPEVSTETPKTPGYQINGSTGTQPPGTTASAPTSKSKIGTVGGRLLGQIPRDSMKIRGGAPELISGRCAMIGIPTVVAYEMTKRETLLQMIANHKIFFAAVVGIIAVASLVPILRGINREALGFMTPEAELINGRAAMIGILGILVLEAKSGVALF